MLKKITTIILTLTILLTIFSGIQTVSAASTLNPYVGFSMTSFDETTRDLSVVTTAGGKLGATGRNQTYTYKDIDFGEQPAISVTLEIAGTAGVENKMVYLYIDSTSNTPIATFSATTTGWGAPIEHTAEITVPVIGVHDLILKTASDADHDFYNIRFTQLSTGANNYVEYDPNASDFPDVSESAYLREINMMHDLGFDLKTAEDTLYYPNLPVTRARFAQVIHKMMGEAEYSSAPIVFNDVVSSADYYSAVSYCSAMGYINGYSDGSFKPNKFIEIGEAVTIISRILGYDTFADAKGGSIANYVVAASRYGIMDGISSSGALTEEIMARLIYNTIIADYYDISSVSQVSEGYELKTDGILSRSLGIYKGEGLVSANNFTSLASPLTSFDDNRVYIGDSDYLAGESDARSLLGYRCEYLYKEENGEKTILWIVPVRNTEITTLTTKNTDILSISANEISYYTEDDKLNRLDIEEGTYIIYNGVAIDDKLSTLLYQEDNEGNEIPFRGYITYVENSKDKNTLLINQYTNVEIGGVSIGDKSIYDNISKQTMNFSERDTMAFFNKNDRPCDLADLLIGDNAILYKSKNKTGKTVYKFLIAENIVSGTVEMQGDGKVYINGNGYRIAPECSETIKIGLEASFALNSFNEIVGLSDKAEQRLVGYLIAQGSEPVPPTGRKVSIKVLTENNTIVEYALNKTCTVDGYKYKDNSAVLSDAMCNNPIGYTLNEQNLVTKIDTVVTNTNNEDDKLREVAAQSGYYWFAGSRTFAVAASGGLNKFILNDNAKVLCTIGDYNTEENYAWRSESVLISDPMTGKAYSFDEKDGFADIFFWTEIKQSSSNAFVVTKKTGAINTEGEEVIVINGYDGSKDVKYAVSNDSAEALAIVELLEKGDWVRVGINGADEITKVEVLYFINDDDAKETYILNGSQKEIVAKLNTTTTSIGSRPTVEGAFAYGKVIDRDGKYITIEHVSGEKEYVYLGNTFGVKCDDTNPANIVLENSVSADSIQIDDWVFFSMSARNVSSVYIINPGNAVIQ